MTPTINPAFAKYVTHIEPSLPQDFYDNKFKLANLEKGLTTHGKVRKRGSKYTHAWRRREK